MESDVDEYRHCLEMLFETATEGGRLAVHTVHRPVIVHSLIAPPLVAGRPTPNGAFLSADSCRL